MDILIVQREFKPTTLKSHQAVIRRLHAAGYVFPTKQRENIPELIKFLSEYPKANVKLNFLNTILVCRDIAGMPTIKIKELRMTISKEGKVENVQTMNTLGETLMKKAEFKTLLDDAFAHNQWVKYILNYLWYNYGVRNQDIDLIFATTKPEMTDLTKNYLYIKSKRVVFIRNNYKTSATHGSQSHIITDKPFYVACNHRMQLGPKLVTGAKIGNAVRKYTINGMYESYIFKMLIADAVSRKDTDEINELSRIRGVSIITIKEYYNINATVEVIREK